MTKKKIHRQLIHHGFHHVLPFGAGTGVSITLLTGYLVDKISELTGNAETIQACIDIIQSVIPLS